MVAVALVAAGCGGDDPPARQEYAANLDRACREFAERERMIGDPQTAAALVRFGPDVLEAFEETILEEVESMEAPDEIRGEAELLQRLARDQRNVLAGLIDAARERDTGRLRGLAAQNRSLNDQAASIARRIGAESCSGG
jgi:hypothetical protein